MELSQEQLEQIVVGVADKLKTQRHNRVVSNDEHNEHHIFIKSFKEKVELDDAAKRKIIQSGKIWCFLLFLGLTASALWTYALEQIKAGAGQ